MRAKTGEAGFTLVELLVGLAVAALVMGLLSATTFQILTASDRGQDKLAVLHDHGTAFQWLNRDAQMGVAAEATVLPTSVTINWTDAVNDITYQSSYAQSGDELVRTLTVDGTPSSQTVARNLDTSGFSASLDGDLLTVSITSVEGDTTQTRTESVLMRAVGSVPLGPIRLATGSYVGNKTNGTQITGIGFQPDVVIIKAERNRSGIIRTSTMTGDVAKVLTSTGALQTNRIESLDADGFTIGSHNDVNQNKQTYHWVAMRAGSDLAVGTYTGDGSDNRSISGVGFQPVWVITMGDGQTSMFRPASVSGGNSYQMTGTGQQANCIQALETAGFQIGSNNQVNQSGITFHYIAWAASSQVTQTTYTGTPNAPRSISGVGFQPEVVWVKRDTADYSVWRPASVSGDTTLYWSASASANDRIRALQSDGFQVGGDPEVNRNNTLYHYLALRDGGP
jgi:prepilin-type N-terminal cleavage/methylation domain-containing protein